MASKSFYWRIVVVVLAVILVDGYQFSNDQPQLSSLSGGGSVFQRFSNHHNHQIMSSSLLPQRQYQYQYQQHQSHQPQQHSSVHRFSNLYGTILHCQDFLTTITTTTTTTTTNQGSMRNGNNNNNHHHTSHLPLQPQSSPSMMDNDLERDLQTLLMAYHQHQPPSSATQSVNSGLIHNHAGHFVGGRYQKNFTFEWQVRINSRNVGGATSNSKLSSSSSNTATGSNKQQQQQYQRAFDQTNLRLTNQNDGTLALAPFDHDSFVPDIHDAFYRCLVRLPKGNQMADSVEPKHHHQQQQQQLPSHTIITSREVHIQAVVERLSKSSSSLPTELSASIATSANNNNKIVSSSSSTSTSSSSSSTAASRAFEDQIRIRIHNSTEVLEGNDAILKCEFDHRNSLYEVYAWYRDDGKIYLPLERLVHTIRRTLGPSQGSGSSINYVNYSSIRHFVIPASGDLLISSVTYRDAKHRYRCQIRHVITNHRQYSQSWAHILFKKTSDYYNSGPRLNPQLQSRHTVAIDEGDPAFFYCSFDGYPQPTIEWFHMDLKSLSMQQSSNQPVAVAFNSYFAQSASSSSSNTGSASHLGDGEGRGGAKEQPESMIPISKQTSSNQYIHGRNFLAIEKVSIEDTGIIACVANNSNSIVRHEMLLFVKNFLQVSLQTSNPLPFPGQDVTLSCNLTTVSSTLSTISAFNAFDSSPLANDDPRYQEQQRWLLQEKRFRELISSHFMLNINWFHNGRLIDFDHRKRRQAEELLSIRDFRGPEDNGVYQCSIRLTAPDYDEEPFMAAIQINSIEKFPEFVDVFTEQIKQNDNQKRDYLSLKCSAHAIPTPQIVWYLDGQELYSNGHVRIETFLDNFGGSGNGGLTGSSSSNSPLARSLTVSFLNISSFHSKDVGMYECVAENYLGSISHRARINQMGSPFIKPLANQTAVLGRPYTINCTYGGYPLEEVYFIKGRHSGSYSAAKSGGQSGQAKRMPFDERHLVPMLGSITITMVEKSDQDFYRCVVVTSNGQKAEQEFYLNVAVAPVISPIIFSDNFEEGKRGSAVCTVTSGDPPILISWFKDGILLDHISTGGGRGAKSSILANNIHYHLNQIQIVPINEFMSSLIIANISRHHQGTYTCMATSPVATTNVSAFLSVKATPIWLLKPSDRIAISGESLTLDCQTSGQPQPVIRWKFLKNEPYRNEPIPILSSQQVHVLENGSLYLRALEPKHSGIYICDASNEISKYPIESRAYVGVSSLPKVSIQNTLGNTVANSMGGGNGAGIGQSSSIIAKESNSMYRGFTLDRLILRKGSQTQLMCSVIGLEQPMVAEWLRPNDETNGGELNADKTTMKKSYLDSSRIVLREETKMNEKRAYLYISHVQRMDSGVYCCMGINPNGHSVAFIELLIQEQPDMPVNFRSVEINSRSVTLNWSIQFDGNSPITSYIVEYRMLPLIKRSFSKNPAGTQQQQKQPSEPGEAKNNNNKILTAKSLTNTITINGLQPQSRYEFRVCAINDLGASQFSEPLILTTEMEAPSLIPIDLRTLVLGSRSIKLIWSIVQPISMDKHPHQQQQQQQPSTTITTMMMMVMNPPLEQIDGFYIGYRPVLSSSSSSSSSSPSMPSISSSISGSSSSGSIDPSMMMIGSMDQSNTNINNNVGPMMDPKTVNGNNNNGKMIPYTFKTMYNLDQNSMLATLLTNGSMAATVSNNNENKLANNNNNNNNNNNMTTFCEIVRRGNGIVDDPSADNPAPSSSSSSSKKSSSNKLRWPLGYNRMNSNQNKQNPMDQIRCVYEFVVNSLQRNTKYGFIVQAFNSKGAGPTSPEVYAQTLLKDPPGKPIIKLTNVSLYEASFVWAMPSNQAEADMSNDIINDFVDLDQTPSSGSPGSINIEGFIIYYRPLIKRLASQPQSSSYQSSAPGEEYSEGSNLEEEDDRFIGRKYQAINWETISVSDKQNSYTLKNLRCGTLYQVRVEAFNEMGSGQSSDVLQFSTLGQAPSVPQSNAFIIANITWAMLDLDRWNNGLCPIINFALRYRLKDPKAMVIGTDGGDPRSSLNNGWITVSSHLKPEFGSMYIIRDLLPGSWYELSIIATNDAGETESRYLFSTLTLDGTTVEPLYASDFNRRHLGVIGGQADSIFEDPMILIPATCAILVLLVIGAATLFIFITRSKEALSRTEHFCRHRDTAHRSHDQLSLNLFSSKNHSKSDLIRSSYQDGSGGAGGDKLTQIETLNCGQTDMMMNGNGSLVQSSQYVEGPTSLTTYTTSGGDDPTSSLPPIMDITNGGTPSRRVKLTNGKTVMESFYSTPCIATQSSNPQQQQQQQQVQLAQQGQFLAQTLGKQGSNKVMMNPHESIYGGDSSTAAQQQQAQQHSYYTHSQFLGGSQENGAVSMVQPGLIVKKKSSDKNHIYELPKQQQQLQQLQQQQSLDSQSQPFEQNDANFVMLVMQQQQAQRTQTLQSPHRIRAEQQQQQQQQQAQHQFRSFHQPQNF